MIMSSFVLVLKNQNKDKVIPIVLFNYIRGQIMTISRFTTPYKAITLLVKPDKSSFDKAALVMTCRRGCVGGGGAVLPTVH